jgi:glucose 1-dehydrogenase
MALVRPTVDSAAPRPLLGRRAVVTGAASGIGRAAAARLVADGAAVLAGDIREDRAQEVATELAAAGGTAVAHKADVSVEADVAEMFAAAERELGGPVDLLVNNAGIESAHALLEMPLSEWQRVLDVNLTGAFLCARQAARGMVGAEIGGVVVNVTSVHELIPWPGYAHYCASKAGLKLFGQTIARELAGHGIRVVAVAPGAVATPINTGVLESPEATRAVEGEIPWGRFGTPEEIAAAIAWVAGPEAEYITGSTLFVDGGMTTFANFV